MDFHILGKTINFGSYAWRAQGRYVNDDGVTLNLDGKVNAYNVSAYYDGQAIISIKFDMDASAAINSEGCTAVNKNDYLRSLIIQNALGFGLDRQFTAIIELKDKGKENIVTLKTEYDMQQETLSMTLQEGEEICIS